MFHLKVQKFLRFFKQISFLWKIILKLHHHSSSPWIHLPDAYTFDQQSGKTWWIFIRRKRRRKSWTVSKIIPLFTASTSANHPRRPPSSFEHAADGVRTTRRWDNFPLVPCPSRDPPDAGSSTTFRPAAQRICIAARGAPVPDRNRATPTLRVGAGFQADRDTAAPAYPCRGPALSGPDLSPLTFSRAFPRCSTLFHSCSARLSPVFQMEEIGRASEPRQPFAFEPVCVEKCVCVYICL